MPNSVYNMYTKFKNIEFLSLATESQFKYWVIDNGGQTCRSTNASYYIEICTLLY